ncbi:TIGR03759 family integrating conjugative element protein [Lelliottia sp. CFBP8978]|uniref:TIGR03759 family integrating conjugative element protein n=1 Tax=Lelliottia sp. CFBP8978 TaxID=3096522 RepID=UPI002A6A40A5|nr:TIGR03759 family integrating conjugative element protein [Lelliottia sp. CFBP8978]MDY1037811.1 TIGR03759 family integrating conjugative element protein [Lelliottia sp. CFBP8978]
MRCYVLALFAILPTLLFASPQQTRIEEQAITHTQAQQWGLTDSEWQRYQQLRQGERGIWSPGLDPLTTLGVEANNDAERQRFAELLARKEHQRVEKELAFQRAYNQAWKRLYPTLTPIRSVIEPRLALFVSEKCPACETLAQELINDDRSLDIWLVNSRNDDASLQRWAQRQHIDMRKVERGQVTLNHDNGRWQRLGGGKLPLLLEQQGEQWRPVSAP